MFRFCKFSSISKRIQSKYLCDICLSDDYPSPLVDWAKTKHVKKACQKCCDKIEKFRSTSIDIFHILVKGKIEKLYFSGRNSSGES